MIRFEKVSYRQFKEDAQVHGPNMTEKEMEAAYEAIILPTRATSGSAGYDFACPWPITLKAGQSKTLASGIRAFMREDVVLMIFPRSGLGSRYRMQLANTVGIIDSDYVYADNEGHILLRLSNDSQEEKTLELSQGERFAQGLFLPFFKTHDDAAQLERKGGHGSTGK